MSSDRTRPIICVVSGLNEAARKIIALDTNSRYRKSRERSLNDSSCLSSYLTFPLDPGTYRNARRGITFGRDRAKCDVVLGTEADRCISSTHFSLSFAWDIGPDPSVVLLHCLSWCNDIALDNSLKLQPGEQIVLDPTTKHVLSVRGAEDLCFLVELKLAVDPRGQAWMQYVAAVLAKNPIRGHVRGRSETTTRRLTISATRPELPDTYGSVRYCQETQGLHADDLRRALLLSPAEWSDLCSAQDCSSTGLSAPRPMYLHLSVGLALCNKVKLGASEKPAKKLIRAISLSARGSKSQVVHLCPDFLETASNGPPTKAVSIQPQDAPEYVFIKCIWNGPMSNVYKKAELRTGKVVAVKQVELGTDNERRRRRILDELRHNRMLDHPNILNADLIIRHPAVDDYEEYAELVMDYFPLGSLETHVRKVKGVDEEFARQYMTQLLAAVAYLHRHKLAHRDIKLGNALLVSLSPVVVKLSDFGLVKELNAHYRRDPTCCGTCDYMAPEVLSLRSKIPGVDVIMPGQPADIWSLGITLFRSLTVSFPFEDADNMVHLGMTDIDCNTHVACNGMSKECKDMLQKMLRADPLARWTANALQEHPWIADRASDAPL